MQVWTSGGSTRIHHLVLIWYFFSTRVTQQGLRVRAQIILGGQRGRYYRPIIDHL